MDVDFSIFPSDEIIYIYHCKNMKISVIRARRSIFINRIHFEEISRNRCSSFGSKIYIPVVEIEKLRCHGV